MRDSWNYIIETSIAVETAENGSVTHSVRQRMSTPSTDGKLFLDLSMVTKSFHLRGDGAVYIDRHGKATMRSESSMPVALHPQQFSEADLVRKFFETALLTGTRRDSYFLSGGA